MYVYIYMYIHLIITYIYICTFIFIYVCVSDILYILSICARVVVIAECRQPCVTQVLLGDGRGQAVSSDPWLCFCCWAALLPSLVGYAVERSGWRCWVCVSLAGGFVCCGWLLMFSARCFASAPRR